MAMRGMTYRDLDKTVAQTGLAPALALAFGFWLLALGQEKQDGRAGGLKRKERPGQWTWDQGGG